MKKIISAGELRAMGVDVDNEIPDEATIERDAVTLSDCGEYVESYADGATFRWLSMECDFDTED